MDRATPCRNEFKFGRVGLSLGFCGNNISTCATQKGHVLSQRHAHTRQKRRQGSVLGYKRKSQPHYVSGLSVNSRSLNSVSCISNDNNGCNHLCKIRVCHGYIISELAM